MITVERALDLLRDATAPLSVERIESTLARGRVLAGAVLADRDLPPTDRSAVDGFAVCAAGIVAGQMLEVVGEVRAGSQPRSLALARGQAVRIMTGAVVPPGADAVVMVEHTTSSAAGDRVTIQETPDAGQCIRRRGEDVRRGESLLRPGAPIQAPEVATLAALGRAQVDVFALPVVHVLATGDELVPQDRDPAEHQVRNSNAPMLLAQLGELGIAGHDLAIAPDDRPGLERSIQGGLSGQILLISGGVSVGRYDLVRETLERAGMDLLFHGVAVKPGKPLLAGRCGDCLVFGLPGNPVSTFACFVIFVAPVLRRVMGYGRWENLEFEATLDRPLATRPGRVTYHLSRIDAVGPTLVARPVPTTGSGDVTSIARANGFIVVRSGAPDLPAGASVPVLLWSDFQLR